MTMGSAPTVAEVMRALDAIAPPHLALDADPRGLLVGDLAAPVSLVLVALDVTSEIARLASSQGAEMILAHHPLIYHPLRTVRAEEAHPGGVVLHCARHGIAVACAHTNWDIAPGGINDVLARLVGIEGVARPLRITFRDSQTETATEYGLGRIGQRTIPTSAEAFLEQVKQALNFPEVRMVGPRDRPIRTVAVGGGACAELLPDAIAQGADALVTSDVRHHEFVDAAARDFVLLDAGHAATETPGTEELARRLSEALAPGIRVRFIR
ncbi:MAG: Nif3-like dinuclear metal center hexameric protein [Cytophagales bacterium]|nr:Nif3-like dinuclear metal center hexameric protein [Armatimonadota bacterium]